MRGRFSKGVRISKGRRVLAQTWDYEEDKTMTKTECLAQLGPKHHATAESLAGAGLDWQTVFALIVQYGPAVAKLIRDLLDQFKKNDPTIKSATGCSCDETTKAHLQAQQAALVQALCANACVQHALGCCE